MDLYDTKDPTNIELMKVIASKEDIADVILESRTNSLTKETTIIENLKLPFYNFSEEEEIVLNKIVENKVHSIKDNDGGILQREEWVGVSHSPLNSYDTEICIYHPVNAFVDFGIVKNHTQYMKKRINLLSQFNNINFIFSIEVDINYLVNSYYDDWKDQAINPLYIKFDYKNNSIKLRFRKTQTTDYIENIKIPYNITHGYATTTVEFRFTDDPYFEESYKLTKGYLMLVCNNWFEFLPKE